MSLQSLVTGDRVSIVSYSPFRGLKGTIHGVNSFIYGDGGGEDWRFYQVDLEGANTKAPIWFEEDEIVPLGEAGNPEACS